MEDAAALRRGERKQAFLSGIIIENPLFVSVLGLCPTLATTTSLESALGMSVLFLFVLLGSNILVSALRKLIPEEITTPCYVIIIATFVTVVKMFTNAFLPELYNSLGVFLSLLVVNCIILGRAEAYASKNGVVNSALDAIGNSIGFAIALISIALIREIIGTGMLSFGKIFTFLPEVSLPILKAKAADGTVIYDLSISLFSRPAGGFFALGFILGVIALIKNHKKLVAAAKKKAEAKKG